jgi:hypothetical protein
VAVYLKEKDWGLGVKKLLEKIKMAENDDKINPSRVLEKNFAEFLDWHENTKEQTKKNYENWLTSNDGKEFGEISFHQYMMNLFFQTPQGGSFKKSLLGCMLQELGENNLIGLNKEKELIEIPLSLLEKKEENEEQDKKSE